MKNKSEVPPSGDKIKLNRHRFAIKNGEIIDRDMAGSPVIAQVAKGYRREILHLMNENQEVFASKLYESK